MAIIERKYKKQVIDLKGPEGNAFVLLGIASKISKQLGFDEDECDKIQNEMKSSDYENLIKVFDDKFGDYIDLMR